ncbi:MAG: anaerobic glycerol-3-phosphate dehydrogenase subunit C, partial [Fidelibacterota bacterium]
EPLSKDSILDEIERCHGCGACRSYCPVASTTNLERSSARSKANLLRGIISGRISPDYLVSEQFKDIIDDCFNCKICWTECPTEVKIPEICTAAKEYYAKFVGISFRDRVLGQTKLNSEMGSLLSPISNITLKMGSFRRLMERITRIDSRRKIQKFYRRSPVTRVFPYRSKGRGPETIVYFSGCYASYSDPEEVRSTLRILEAFGVKVFLPQWRCCGIAKMSLGDIESVREDSEMNVDILFSYVRRGIKVIVSSASCGLALKYEYPRLLETTEAEQVARNIMDIHEFIGENLLNSKYAIRFEPVKRRVVYHDPCHLKVQRLSHNPLEILSKIPQLELMPIEDSCCGIAGTFGFKNDKYDLSLMIGKRLFDSILKVEPDLVLTGCGTCQIQIQQNTGIDCVHPVKLISESLKLS